MDGWTDGRTDGWMDGWMDKIKSTHSFVTEQFCEVLRQLCECWSSLRGHLPTVQHEHVSRIRRTSAISPPPLHLYGYITNLQNDQLPAQFVKCCAATGITEGMGSNPVLFVAAYKLRSYL